MVAPQRQESLAQAGQRALAAATAYSRTKEMHLDTADACAAQGSASTPLWLRRQGHGRVMLRPSSISQAVAAREGDQASLAHARLLQWQHRPRNLTSRSSATTVSMKAHSGIALFLLHLSPALQCLHMTNISLRDRDLQWKLKTWVHCF